ncbi:helix-turn-helix domain-containing protein [Hyphobacterium sp.]|uniref:helix-turn-helix domain-containing protein n=1 Tax=Hyphobacterium sp. TaxID=2004662 RepID=UPI00374A7AEF
MQKTFNRLIFFPRRRICLVAEQHVINSVQQEGVGRKLYEKRLELGLSKKALAKALEVSSEVIGLWERGIHRPRVSQMPAIISFVGTSEWLPKGDLANRLYRVRCVLGWPQEKLASYLGVSAKTVALMEKGQKSAPQLVRTVSEGLKLLEMRGVVGSQ